MGQGVCCVQKRLELTVDCFSDSPPFHGGGDGGAAAAFGLAYLPTAGPPAALGGRSAVTPSSPSRPREGEDDFAAEVARQIATDRRQHLYETASLLPVLYDVKPPELDEPQNTATAVHRKTAVTRQLSSFRKPRGVAAQEQLHSFIGSLQRVSARSETVVKVFEVFEDYVNVHLLHEYCTGGTVYERILDRQHFTEQESAVLVRHMLLAIAPLHDSHLHHGSLTPESFRFLNSTPHAALKLVDFGAELKIHRWDAVEHLDKGPDLQNPHCARFFETCKLVFCAPEFAPPYQPSRKRRGAVPLLCDAPTANGCARSSPGDGGNESIFLDEDAFTDIMDEHAEWFEQRFEQQQQDSACDYDRKYASADIWSIGAIAFLLLCGYPPFFAPSRNAILGRIHRTEFSFDPPFWSKISEEGKSFVQSCINESWWERMSVHEALNHPWIQRLADTSPSGSMFSSFMLNLRRFYRASLIETYVGNMLAQRFKRQDMHDFLKRCKEIDTCGSGFFTASDLKHVLTALGHRSISEAITARFLRAFRHPGESYIDYVALLDSIYLRQQRIFEEELWKHLQRVCQSNARAGAGPAGWLQVGELTLLFGDPVVVGLLMREIPETAGLEEQAVCRKLQTSLHDYAREHSTTQLEFHDLATTLLRLLRSWPVVPTSAIMEALDHMIVEAEVL